MFFPEAFAGTIPLTGSDVAARWDSLYGFLVWISVAFFVVVVGAMLYFSVAYKHKPGKKTKYITGHHLLEGIWIAVPTLLLLVIFGWGYSVYHAMTQAPSDAYEVRVIGKQWLWTFQYNNGRTTVNELFVPVNHPVKLIMTSEDVLHSFFIPNFRVKQDVVPGIYSSVWFTATVPGKHQVFCAEYCGTSHSTMLAKVVALTDSQWDAWNRNQKLGNIPEAAAELVDADDVQPVKATRAVAVSLIDQGRAVYRKNGCNSCHSVTDDSVKIGPSHKGLFGRKVLLANGKAGIADENYIRDQIENPKPPMPTYRGLINETEMNALLAYIKSIKDSGDIDPSSEGE